MPPSRVSRSSPTPSDLLDVRPADGLRRLPPGRGDPRPAGRRCCRLAGVVTPLAALLAWGIAAACWRRGPVTTKEQVDEHQPIETRDLVRDFERTRAVDGMTFSLAARGSGRLHRRQRCRQVDDDQDADRDPQADRGHVRTCGLDPMHHRVEVARRVGVVFGQRSQLWWDLPLRDSFAILGAIHRPDDHSTRARTDLLVEQLEMGRSLGTPVRCCRWASGCGPRSRPRCCTPRSCSSSTSPRSVSTSSQAAAA